MPTANPHLADNLHRLMGMHRVGQKEVAERLGTTKQSVSEWASRRKMPRQAVLAGARAFAQAPIRYAMQRPTVRPSADYVDEFNAGILKLPPKGLSAKEVGEFRQAQREPGEAARTRAIAHGERLESV